MTALEALATAGGLVVSMYAAWVFARFVTSYPRGRGSVDEWERENARREWR